MLEPITATLSFRDEHGRRHDVPIITVDGYPETVEFDLFLLRVADRRYLSMDGDRVYVGADNGCAAYDLDPVDTGRPVRVGHRVMITDNAPRPDNA